ncbi:MAG: trypsin-like peptidase domain-containing protein, partial [Solirubrobacterales bacterium]|nr:trypsin-like peptidase domain-containing protein [Solirubrobacterales bacterium]
ERPLPLAPRPAPNTPAAIIGFPLDGPLDIQPGRIAQAEVASTQDAYGNGPIQRSIQPLRGLVRPGNSGGPLIDAAGDVVGTVFAAISGTPTSSGGDGLAVPNQLVRAQLARAEAQKAAVSSGPCAG